MVWEIQGSKVGYTKTEIMHSVIHDLPNFKCWKQLLIQSLSLGLTFLQADLALGPNIKFVVHNMDSNFYLGSTAMQTL